MNFGTNKQIEKYVLHILSATASWPPSRRISLKMGSVCSPNVGTMLSSRRTLSLSVFPSSMNRFIVLVRRPKPYMKGSTPLTWRIDSCRYVLRRWNTATSSSGIGPAHNGKFAFILFIWLVFHAVLKNISHIRRRPALWWIKKPMIIHWVLLDFPEGKNKTQLRICR